MNEVLVQEQVNWMMDHPRTPFGQMPRRAELTDEEYYEVVRRVVYGDIQRTAARGVTSAEEMGK